MLTACNLTSPWNFTLTRCDRILKELQQTDWVTFVILTDFFLVLKTPEKVLSLNLFLAFGINTYKIKSIFLAFVSCNHVLSLTVGMVYDSYLFLECIFVI